MSDKLLSFPPIQYCYFIYSNPDYNVSIPNSFQSTQRIHVIHNVRNCSGCEGYSNYKCKICIGKYINSLCDNCNNLECLGHNEGCTNIEIGNNPCKCEFTITYDDNESSRLCYYFQYKSFKCPIPIELPSNIGNSVKVIHLVANEDLDFLAIADVNYTAYRFKSDNHDLFSTHNDMERVH